MARKGERRRSYDPLGMRERVLDAAAELFQARGYHATSMHEVMAAAGVTGGALYHHFPSKKALGLAVISERVARDVEETWIAPVRSAPTAAEGVLGVFDATIAGLDRRGRIGGCPLNNLAVELSLADPAFATASAAVFDAWRDAIAERLGANGEARSRADLVVAAFSGAMAMAKASQSTAPLRSCAHELSAVLDA